MIKDEKYYSWSNFGIAVVLISCLYF